MDDTRLRRAIALVDDARCLVADVLDEAGVTLPESHHLMFARGYLNKSLQRLDKAYTPQPEPEGDAA